MKIGNISSLQYGLEVQNNTNQVCSSSIKNNLSFTSRMFSAEQLKKSEDLITNYGFIEGMNTLHGYMFGSLTMGGSMIMAFFRNRSLQTGMLKNLGEILKVSGDDMSKLSQTIKEKCLPIKEAGKEFIERAKNLD